MRTVLLAAMLMGAAPAADAGGPHTYTFLALEPPPVHLAGGYDLGVGGTSGDYGVLLDQAIALHLQDPLRGVPLGRRLLRPRSGPGPNHFAVVVRGGLLAPVGLAAAPTRPRGQMMELQVVLEDPEFWEGWQIDQADSDGGRGSWSFCLSREATLRANLKVTDGIDGRVIEQVPLDYKETATGCGADRADAERRVTPEGSLSEFAVDGIARRVAEQVAPRWVVVEARLVRKGGAGRGHKLARSGDLPAATRWYVDAVAKSPQDPWLRYHAALLLTAGFHFAQAREHLGEARRLADEPVFVEWEEELHRRERASLMLRRIGVPQEPVRY